MDLCEFQTRRQLIDVALDKRGWDVKNKAHVIVEVDTKQSNFAQNQYKFVSETLKNDLDSKYADYLLLDDQGAPLAIIEAKRTSKDPLLAAQTQAEEYAKDIIAQTGKSVFIFLANGYETYFWNYPHETPRIVKGFFPKSDLEKIRWINENKRPLVSVGINTDIVDRTKSIEVTKRTLEHFDKKHRKALIVMATGTGKTRVAMAIIDALKKANWAKKVLFIADRRRLRQQAYAKGYKKFFPEEAKETIHSGVINTEKNLFVTTIQTLQECYEDIPPSFFDLIISDEAHRSIYDKWKPIFTYYDCLQIGLTATPREAFAEDDMRDTFRFFECDGNQPTSMYDYEDAVNDGVLVDFRRHILGAQAGFQIEGLKSKHLTQSMRDKLIEEGKNPDDVNFEGTDFERKFVTKGTNDAIIKEFMENCIMDRSGSLPAKSIIFAMTKNHAKRLYESFNRLYPDLPGVAKIIVSDDSYSEKAIDGFEEDDLPRVAISVDILDTGVDVEEICNLVFAKPVFSRIKFWQMLGRGTRNDASCEHREWLPDGKKTHFKVFDFFNNFENFSMNPAGDESKPQDAIAVKLFRTRVEQLARFTKGGDANAIAQSRQKILDDLNTIPTSSASIQEFLLDLNKAKSPDFYERKGINQIEFLLGRISPLLKFKTTNYEEASFMLKCEKLGLAILQGDAKVAERYAKQIAETLECLPDNIQEVKEKLDLIQRARLDVFYHSITYEQTQELMRELTHLMKYKLPQPRTQIIVDLDDMIVQRKIIEFGPEATQVHVKEYRERVEKRIQELVQTHPTIKKILNREQITDEDIAKLEEAFNSPDLGLTEDVLAQFYKGTLVQFIREVCGLYRAESWEEQVKKAFETHLVELNKKYSADQFNFIRTLQSVFTKTRQLAYETLWDPPFSNFGVLPTELFQEDELKEWVSFCNKLAQTI